MEEQHFTIIMTGRNSAPYIEKSIKSALNQKYDNYEIILFDAESTDGSYEIAVSFEENFSNKLSVIRNKKRQYQGQNILEGVKLAIPKSICVTLDSDDYFPDEYVLSKLNKIYNENIWMTYGGSYIESTGRDVRNFYSAYPEEIINKSSYREYRWLGSHLRSFRKELFLKINISDLKDYLTGKFYSMAPDLSFMWPMLEMSGYKAKYLNDILYVYNTENPSNESKINQKEIDRIEEQIRSKPKYLRLAKLYD